MKDMGKIILVLTAMFLVLVGTAVFGSQSFITGNVVSENKYFYSYTKAICDEDNFCQDYEISCSGDEVMKLSPITGAVAKFPSDWEDPRSKEAREKIC